METRGDASVNGAKITRTFKYGPPDSPSANQTPSTIRPSLLSSVTDFENHTACYGYYGTGDANGPAGYLSSVMDFAGNTTTYGREPITGKVNKVTLPDGRTRSSVWGGMDGNAMQPYFLFQTTDERQRATVYHRYSNTGFLYQVDYPDGGHTTYGYQGFSHNGFAFYKVQVVTDQRGAQMIYGYDETDVAHGGSGYPGLLTSVTRSYNDGYGNVKQEKTLLYYDGWDRVVKSVDARNVTEEFAYNNRHQLTKVTHDADGTHVDYTYDDYGNRTKASDELGHTTVTAYDEYRRVLSVTTPVNYGNNASRYVAFAYDYRNNSDTSTASARSHTSANWGVSCVNSSKAVQRIFSPNNWLTDQYDGMYVDNGGVPHPGAGEVHQSFTYNGNGQLLQTVDAQGQPWTNHYDSCGRVDLTRDPLDAAGTPNHLTASAYFGPNEADQAGVNSAGLLKTTTVPAPDLGNGYVGTGFTKHDEMGRVLKTVSPYAPGASAPYNNTFGSKFNYAGDLVSQTDGTYDSGQGHATGYTPDQLGRPAVQTYPDGSTEQWTYDAGGNVATYKNRAGAYCDYTFDQRNFLRRTQWRGGEASPTGYGYDAAGRLTEVDNYNAYVSLAYDDAGDLVSETATILNQPARATTYDYDADGNVVTIHYPNTNIPSFSYDDQQRCTGMNSGGVTYSQYNYYGNWLAGRWINPGVYTGYGYQLNGRLADLWHYHGSSDGTHAQNQSISRHLYGYTPDGRISWFDREADGGQSGSALENGYGDAYYYFPDGRLAAAYRDVVPKSGWPQAASATQDSRVDNTNGNLVASPSYYYDGYQYDAPGNRTLAVGQNQPDIHYADNGKGQNQYSGSAYDNNGNTIDSVVGWGYSFDAENHLLSAKSQSTSELVKNLYDGLGRLVYRNVNGAQRIFYYSGQQRVEERDYTNGTSPLYLYFYDAPGSDSILWREGGGWGRLWHLTDAMGSTTHLVNDAGTVVEQYLYDAYGTPTVYNGQGRPLPGNVTAWDNRYLWHSASAYEWLAGPKLYHCRARFYLPQHGRFLQPDPIGQAGGLNVYAYCNDDPINGDDPNGLTEVQADADGSANPVITTFTAYKPSVDRESPADTQGSGGSSDSGSGSGSSGTNSSGSRPYMSGGTVAGALLAGSLGPAGPFVGGGGAGKLINRSDPNFLIIHAIPPNSKTFVTPTGNVFYAPSGTDFMNVLKAGLHQEPIYSLMDSMHWGPIDFQRNKGAGRMDITLFYKAYTDASNYAVGVILYGAGVNEENTVNIARNFAMFGSSNAGAPAQEYWQKQGWRAARSGKPNGSNFIAVPSFPGGTMLVPIP